MHKCPGLQYGVRCPGLWLTYSVLGCPGLGLVLGFGVGLWVGVGLGVWNIPGHLLAILDIPAIIISKFQRICM